MKTGRRRREKDDEDVVEDSEPEREEQRQQEKRERKRRKHMSAGATVTTLENKVIEPLTVQIESKENTGQGQHAAPRIADGSTVIIAPPDVEVPCPCAIGMNAESEHSAVDTIDLVNYSDRVKMPLIRLVPFQSRVASLPSQKPIRRSFPTPPPIEVLAPSDDSGDEGGSNRLKLGRFAFKMSQSSIRSSSYPKIGLSRTGSLATVDLGPLPKAKKVRSASHRFADNFSNAEIGRLMKCISCDARWTARKTANQKMAHIQSCAKKNALSATTVRALIQKEVDAALEEDSSRIGKANTSEGDDASTTFLNKVVNEVCSKKGRRPTVLETVKTLPETRDNILARARALLGTGQSGPLDAEPNATQVFGQSKLAGKIPDPLADITHTQVFAESALGRKRILPA